MMVMKLTLVCCQVSSSWLHEDFGVDGDEKHLSFSFHLSASCTSVCTHTQIHVVILHGETRCERGCFDEGPPLLLGCLYLHYRLRSVVSRVIRETLVLHGSSSSLQMFHQSLPMEM